MELAYSLGTVGGNAANVQGALEWSVRAAARAGELEAALHRARSDEDSAAREIRRLERTLRSLVAIRPALDALVGVARVVIDDAPLAAVWETFGGFLAKWLLAPGEGAALVDRLGDAMIAPCAGTLGRTLTGFDALDFVEQRLLSLRAPRGRFGDPAVYVGSVASAAGLEFRAVRVVGLCEGVLPSQPHESPVLPERARAVLERNAPAIVLPRARDRVSFQVHSLWVAICGGREEVVLSAPRVDIARTEREPSAIFIEAAAAVARPDATTGARASAVPNRSAIVRDYLAPARAAAAEFTTAHPVGELAWLARAASAEPLVPPAWSSGTACALDRVATLRTPSGPLGPMDGVLGKGAPFPDLPGLVPGRPISASALQQLLQCPRMFLMRRVLGWDDPAAAPLLRELDALSFGSLLHRVVEDFYREHGEEFVARKKTIAQWKKLAFATAERAFEEFLSEYPLVGERVRDKERERLRDALSAFLEYDWDGPAARRFVGVELGFGQGAPLAVAADGVTLQLYGFIDRVDVEDGVTVVRDLKSGQSHPRRGDEAGPTALRDVQLGVYMIAAKKLAASWKAPKKVVGAYAYASGQGDVEERAFRDDAAALEKATAGWLATAAHVLQERAFSSTPDEGDCDYCSFRPLCGTHAAARAAEGLDGAGGALGRFRALKLGDGDEE
jgi:RecB family exonuclease